MRTVNFLDAQSDGGDFNSETTSESEDETEGESTEDSAENDDTSLSS